MNCYELHSRIYSTLCIVLTAAALLHVNAAAVNYTNQWAVHIEGGEALARHLAQTYEFTYVNKIFDDYYQFEHRRVHKRSMEHSAHVHADLAMHPKVKWLEQQVIKRRVKRSIRNKKNINFNDPQWPQMWYLNRGGMRVMEAWAQGYTGKGVVVTILDDGIELNHPDLKNNYDADASYDVNSNDEIPQPRYDHSNENKHGTRCAGEVAAQANNNVCNVGVAFNARIGGVRMLDGDVTDSVEAKSLSHHPQHVQIYSASWGPDDDGRTVDGPATLARKAFYDGITKGRGMLGSIFVWASGNGGRATDNCNCDGYTNSIYTLSISSVTQQGHIPWYSEACSSTLATTYSSGSGGEKQIVTTDLHNSCTISHTGTSASAPLAAGVVALALEANPMLTWRDMQHIVVATAKPEGLKANDWRTNGLGRRVSHSFGFGLMDADAMVRLARNWTTVGEQHICEVASSDTNRVIPRNGKLTLTLAMDGCLRTRNYVKYLEHVEAKITLTASKRGAIQIYLTSPMGTRSTLLARRQSDTASDGFNNWAFMTTHNWGEKSRGVWLLEIENADTSSLASVLRSWSVLVYGTDKLPHEKKSRMSRMRLTSVYVTDAETPVAIQPTQKTPTHKPPSWRIPQPETRHEHSKPTGTAAILVYPFARWVSKSGGQGITSRGQCVYETMSLEQYTTSSARQEIGGKSSRWPFVGYRPYRVRHWYRREFHRHTKIRNARKWRPKKPKRNVAGEKLVEKADLKSWSLVVMGTSLLPQSTSYPITGQFMDISGSNQSYVCAGKVTSGICLECRPGYFLMASNCVSRCPPGYYGSVSPSPVNETMTIHPDNTTIFLSSHAVCSACHEECLECRIVTNPECVRCRGDLVLNKSSGSCQAKSLLWRHASAAITAVSATFIGLFSLIIATFAIQRCRVWRDKADQSRLLKKQMMTGEERVDGISMKLLDEDATDNNSDNNSDCEVRT